MNDNDRRELEESRERDFERVQAAIKPRLERAARAYSQSLTSLWIGNAGAAIATLSFIGAAWRNGKEVGAATIHPVTFPHALLIPLTLFVLGLISMAVGSFSNLLRERKTIRMMEDANSIWDFTVDHVRRPSEEAGLTFRDWQTRWACLSAAFFIFGCATGLVQLWNN